MDLSMLLILVLVLVQGVTTASYSSGEVERHKRISSGSGSYSGGNRYYRSGCQDVRYVSNGRLYKSNYNRYGSVLKCSCNTGYHLRTYATYTCKYDRKWHRSDTGSTWVAFYCDKDLRPCLYNGRSIANGKSLADGCKVCYCRNGVVSCSTDKCPKPCTANGKTYKSGETYQVDCNVCSCLNGQVKCSNTDCDKSSDSNDKDSSSKSSNDNTKKDSSKSGSSNESSNSSSGEHSSNSGSGENSSKSGSGKSSSSSGSSKSSSSSGSSTSSSSKTESSSSGDSESSNSSSSNNGSKQCEYNGITYVSGQTFKDGCKACTCENGIVGCLKNKCPMPCNRNNNTYESGAMFKEDCNTCRCYNGLVKCTSVVCPKPCVYNGKTYANLARWQPDDCNNCVCSKGQSVCTTRVCPKGCTKNGKTYTSGEAFKVDCNVCTCLEGQVNCSDMNCAKEGICPPPDRKTCSERCKYDTDCPNTDKCCSTGCGHDCYAPFKQDKPCVRYNKVYQSGDTFQVGCNLCSCDDGQISCSNMHCPYPCKHKDVWYKHGASFMEDCNTCSCHNGNVECTKIKCPASCTYNGKTYHSGSSCSDSCNTCTCNDGVEVCTKIPCYASCTYNGKAYQDGDSFKNDCNDCACKDGHVACTQKNCNPCSGVTCPKLSCNTYVPDGKCCPVCDAKCIVGYKTFDSGNSWQVGCNTCTCTNGHVTCTAEECNPCANIKCAPLTCKHTYLQSGKCCPVCTCKDRDNATYSVGDDMPPNVACRSPCKCGTDGEMKCAVVDCPRHDNCFKYNVEPGKCCGTCEKGCTWRGSIIKEGAKIKDGPCKDCVCHDGNMDCVTQTCPPKTCPGGVEPLARAGDCCPTYCLQFNF